MSVSSGRGSSLNLTGSLANDKLGHMKNFISTALEYNRTRSESCANQLNRYLHMIGVTIDLSTFDPHSSVVTEFYVSLHELMSNLESRSTLLWASVNVLQQACRNRAAHHALIHTYQFLPILTRFLDDQLTREKKVRLLTLIQELTYGIRISWQEPHIPHLIATMVKWITPGETNVINLSLGVIINLCYKNLPALYTLMRCVDTKSFMRTVMRLDAASIQVCKLLIILENVNGEVPKQDILKFLSVAFDTIADALKKHDVVVLRHIVDFFIDVKSQYNQRAAFAEFKDYQKHIEKLITIVNTTTDDSGDKIHDPECVAMLFEFLLALVQLNITDIIPLYTKLAQLALSWVQTEHVQTQALALLRSVATAQEIDTEQILQPLADGLQILLIAFNTGCNESDTNTLQTNEYQTSLAALLHLLREMVKCQSLRNLVLQGLKIESVSKVFSPITHVTLSPRHRDQDTFSESAVVMYINALALVRELSPLNNQWQSLYIQLMSHKQIHMVIAHAFCKGNAQIKSLVFQMAKTFEFHCDKISQAFLEIQPLVDYSISTKTLATEPIEQQMPYTIMSREQEEKLDQLICKLQDALHNNQITNTTTSDVMELYEYKVAAMGHAERAAQASLEAAGKQAIHLKHRLAQMSAESSRLHQMLFHAQQCQEQSTNQLKQIEENSRQMVVNLAKKKTYCTELENQLKAAQSQLQIRNNELHVCEERYRNAVDKIKTLEKQLEESSVKNTELNNIIKKSEDKLVDMEKRLEETKQKAKQKIANLTEEVKSYEVSCKNYEEQISDKNKECLALQLRINELQQELQDYKSKLEWIVQISMNQVKP